MIAPRISLCTYTYNDAPFVHDLLRAIPSWVVRPDEIVVLDDGSKVRFAPERDMPGLRVVRLEKNQGITRAKGRGLSEARGELIFSLDCDTRIAPDWLAVNLPNLVREDVLHEGELRPVGLVGGALVYTSGEDLVSRYLRLYGDNHNLHHIGPVEFIPGNAFLLRRSTWEEVGGFTGFAETNCEDHYLCSQLLARGYALFSDARAKAWQVRRIRRTTLCMRVWKWCHKAVKGQMLPGDRMIPYLFEVGVKPMLTRFETSIERGEPLFLYIELLYLAHMTLDCLDYAVSTGMASGFVRAGFLRRLAMLFEGYPRLWERLRADLGVIGHSVLMPAAGDEAAWEDYFLFADMLRNSGLFQWMERDGLRILMVEDRAENYHFSSYASATFGMAPGS